MACSDAANEGPRRGRAVVDRHAAVDLRRLARVPALEEVLRLLAGALDEHRQPPPQSGEFPSERRELPLASGEFPLVSEGFPLASADLPLLSGDSPLACGDFPHGSADFPSVRLALTAVR